MMPDTEYWFIKTPGVASKAGRNSPLGPVKVDTHIHTLLTLLSSLPARGSRSPSEAYQEDRRLCFPEVLAEMTTWVAVM